MLKKYAKSNETDFENAPNICFVNGFIVVAKMPSPIKDNNLQYDGSNSDTRINIIITPFSINSMIGRCLSFLTI